MMGGEQFCTTAYLEMIHFSLSLQPPLELQIGPGGFGQNDVTLHSPSIVWRVRRLYTKYILDDFGQNDVALIEEPRSSVH